jgi:tripartite-type tricarboxylate transporter receptor subunit TctC
MNHRCTKRFGTGRFCILEAILVSSLLFAAALVLAAETKLGYPKKAIDLVLAVPPGGGVDIPTRMVVGELRKQLGQPINVINRPGGNRVVGVQSVMTSTPDGYTLLGDGFSTSSGQVVIKSWPFPLDARTYIARAAMSPLAFIVSSKRPWKNLSEFKDALLAAKPRELCWASNGRGATGDFALLQFFDAIGFQPSKLRVVVHSGAAPSATTVAGGHADFSAPGLETALSFAGGGTVRILAVTSPARVKDLEDVPTTKEQGFPEVDGSVWMGFSGPAGLGPEVVEVISKALQKALAAPEAIEALRKVKCVPAYLGPAEFKSVVIAEGKKVKKLLGGE